MTGAETLEEAVIPEGILLQAEPGMTNEEIFRFNSELFATVYPDEWVAIYQGNFEGHDRSHRKLIKYLTDRKILRAYIERTYVRDEQPDSFSGVN